MGFDTKYGKVTTEFGEIPDDEPVIVFRGRDKNVVDMLDYYWELCQMGDSPDHHLDLIRRTQHLVENWQVDNADRVKTPDSNRYMERISQT
jgi:hypothetical protein